MSAERYEPVAEILGAMLPPVTREEAGKAAELLRKHFTPTWPVKYSHRRYRNVPKRWISTEPAPSTDSRGYRKTWHGWGRLVHDVSHDIFDFIYPRRRAHDPLHAHYEKLVAEYVANAGWLTGALRPTPKPKLSTDEKRRRELIRTEDAIVRWTSKAKRAATKLRKLRIKQRRLIKITGAKP